jgi:hypothetical protein
MAERKSFLLRVDQELLLQLQRWADDDLRSLNGQIEFLLRKTLRDSGRAKSDPRPGVATKNGDEANREPGK